MLGYDISWAAFNIIEVMSASKFTFKVRRARWLWDLNRELAGAEGEGVLRLGTVQKQRAGHEWPVPVTPPRLRRHQLTLVTLSATPLAGFLFFLQLRGTSVK